jgi:hypothetical protein
VKIDPKLYEFCTVRQLEVLEAIDRGGSNRKAAKALGVHHGAVDAALAAVRKKAAREGHAPGHFESGVAPGYAMGKVTVQRGPGGDVERTWERQSPEMAKAEEMMRAAIEAMAEEIPRLPALPAPVQSSQGNLCNCYVITDFHLSMLSHSEETGADWDVKIAEKMLVDWFAQAIALSPNSEVGVFAQLSDLLHADGLEPLTPASKHVLDVDSRFYKVVRTVIRVLRKVIDMLLAKHPRLHIIMADANHDPVSAIWLREWLAVLYEDEPRITVDKSPNPYNAFEFGKVALFFHHGHKRKVTNVSEVFAAQFREMFGRTKYAYAHTGHLHHIDVKENNLMIVEQHRTLAAQDAYSARGGYLSGRDAQVITYHRDFGEVSRVRINSDMLR